MQHAFNYKIISKTKLLWALLLPIFFWPQNSNAALPFVTDDAFIQKKNGLALETFVEKWNLPQKAAADKRASTLYSYYLSASYGLLNNLEVTAAANAGYDLKDHSASFVNPLLQLKTQIFESKAQNIPSLAIDFGYINHNGKGEYYDDTTNYYVIGAATVNMLDDNLIIHLNLGKKASFAITHDHLYRTHLGFAIDFAVNKKFRIVAESYNGAPNSPRDSPGYFRSYQVGVRWVKAPTFIPYFIFGIQPSFAGYDEDERSLYRTSNWAQVGARIVFGN